MRGLLVAVALAFVVLVAGPAAYADESDYPPGLPGIGVPGRPAKPEPGALPQTGNDISHELALGTGLIVTGAAILIAVRRRRALSR